MSKDNFWNSFAMIPWSLGNNSCHGHHLVWKLLLIVVACRSGGSDPLPNALNVLLNGFEPLPNTLNTLLNVSNLEPNVVNLKPSTLHLYKCSTLEPNAFNPILNDLTQYQMTKALIECMVRKLFWKPQLNTWSEPFPKTLDECMFRKPIAKAFDRKSFRIIFPNAFSDCI